MRKGNDGERKRIVVGISGASGARLGVRLLEALREAGAETHLVISEWGKRTIRLECGMSFEEAEALGSFHYEASDMAAPVASGSFLTDAMVIIPCSMKTLSAVANGYADNLIARAADVCIKERRTLIVVPRETPLSGIHLRNMRELSDAGAVIMPPCMSFYGGLSGVDDMIDHFTGRVLDQLGMEHSLCRRWEGDKGVQG